MRQPKPAITALRREALPLSGPDLLALMQSVFAAGAVFRFQARGQSMLPFIQDGDLVTVAPSGQAPPKLGRVAAFIQPATGQLVLHRIIARRGTSFLIQGDHAAGQADGWVEAAAVLGCLVGVERHGRRMLLGLGPERSLLAWLSRRGWLERLYWKWLDWQRRRLK